MPKWTTEQNLAINETGKNIIVSAGAGSGKTAVLSERVLTIIKSGIHIDELLILTFTNAAAAEMKERIRKKLRSDDALKEELDKVDIAYITTFDAYALSLVKKYNYLLNVSDNISIIDNGIITLKKREILNQIFDNLYQEKNPLFLKLIDDFCLKSDDDILENILTISNKLDNSFNKKSYLENYIEENFNENILNNYVDKYLSIIKNKINSIKNMINNLAFYVDYEYIEKINAVLTPLYNASTYEEARLNINVSIPRLPNGSCEEAKIIKKEINDYLKNLSNYFSYNTTSEIKNTILLTKDYATIITKIILELDKQIWDFKMEHNSFEFVDISKMAIKILQDNENVRLELKNTYKEILIDEYQDTNDLQDLFISYIENNNVYMVGDIKQSIYRFRNANPLLFKTKYDNYARNNGGFKIDLNKNFRSRKEVTENINLIFNLIMDNDIGGANYEESHQMVFGNTSYNDVNKENYQMEILNYNSKEILEYSKEEIEIFTIAKDIKDKIAAKFQVMDKDTLQSRDITYSDFVILIDRSSSFNLYKKIFEYLNIPLAIYKDASITDSSLIGLIRNLYNLIIKISKHEFDTSFKYSFVSIARSYLFDMLDEEILKIINSNSYKDTEIYIKCFNIAKNIDTLNNGEFYNAILDEFNFYDKIITIGNVLEHQVTLESINKIVNNTNTFGYSPLEFLDYLNSIADSNISISLSLNKNDSNSVKIMTIHASKGLEYHICYFSGLYKKFNILDLKELLSYSPDYGLILPYYDKGPKSTILKTLTKQKYMLDEISEKLRLFYVALTRAREKIILVLELEENILAYKNGSIIDDEARLKFMSFKDMLDSIYPSIKNYIKNVDLENIGLTKDYNFSRFVSYKDTLKEGEKILVKEYVDNSKVTENKHFSKEVHNLHTKEEFNNILMGKKLHQELEELDFNNSTDSRFKKLLERDIFKNAKNIYKEYEFMYEEDNKKMHGFIDCLIEYDDKYIIIDYKLKNVIDDAYKKQLHGYKKYIEDITGKLVYTYLYSLVDDELIAIVK